MKAQLRIGEDGAVEAELMDADPDDRWIVIDVREGKIWTGNCFALTVWESDNPRVFRQLAQAFDIDLSKPAEVDIGR